MKYMLLIYSPENAWTKDEWLACTQKSSAICHELAAKGQFVDASPLHPVATAKSVRVRDGQRMVTAGPYAETTEQLGGYYVLDVADLDEVIAIAARLPPATKGTVEIRPMLDLPGLPPSKPSQASEGSMRVMMIAYDNEQEWERVGEVEHRAGMEAAVKLTHQIASRGHYITASPLHPTSTATCVRVRNGKRVVTDGPFAETHEVLGGFYLLNVKSLDDAIDYAVQHPGQRFGGVELRQVYDLANLP